MGKVIVVGIGPGSYEDMTIRADRALQSCDAIVGYGVYVDLVKERYPDKAFYETPMTQEAKRCALALELARAGKTAAMVCSGDSGIYGMAALHAAVISLSDRLTPWETIEKRLTHAAKADLTIALYNPASRSRPAHLKRACDILLRDLPDSRLCGIARSIGRAGESWRTLTLGELRETEADMFCTVIVGNVSTKEIAGRLITPRGYKNV